MIPNETIQDRVPAPPIDARPVGGYGLWRAVLKTPAGTFVGFGHGEQAAAYHARRKAEKGTER